MRHQHGQTLLVDNVLDLDGCKNQFHIKNTHAISTRAPHDLPAIFLASSNFRFFFTANIISVLFPKILFMKKYKKKIEKRQL